MTTATIPINEIVVLPQPRRTFSNIDSLAADIREHGLLQPVTITPSKRLLYGERRLRACRLLNMDAVPVIVGEELPDDEILERQIAENVARDDLSWQERSLAMLDLHRKKRQRGALEGWSWGQREAAELFKMELGTVNYVLRVAKRLEQELALPEDKRKYWNYTSANEAYRLGLLGEEEDRLNALLAAKARDEANRTAAAVISEKLVELDKVIEPQVDGTTLRAFSFDSLTREEQEKRYYSGGLNPPGSFDEYIKERNAVREEVQNTINLSGTIIHGDCIQYMLDPENANLFDHIITDPPYAIDMDNLNQSNVHGGLVDLDRVVDAHDVDENLELLAKFFPAAFACTKEMAFVITFCDAMVWQYLYDHAVAAGFAVQRWPLIWRKVNQAVMNNCAQYNTTKDYEIAMVCRKPKTVVVNKLNTSIIDGSNVEVTKLTGHPFAKPFEVTRRLLDTFTTEGQLILEPFAGGGSMIIEMLRANRRVVAIEKEEHHYNSLLENIKQQYYLKLNPKFKFI